MRNIFFTSDTHLFHANFLKFVDEKGERIRPFDSVEAMNERIVAGWNSVVRDGDYVYHLGDVTFEYGRPFNELMARLKGRKRLILGNHDQVKGTELLRHFEKFGLWRLFKDNRFICTHIPIMIDEFRAKAVLNVHGHKHKNVVMEPCSKVPDRRYLNVCVEQTNYVPMHIDTITQYAKDAA